MLRLTAFEIFFIMFFSISLMCCGLMLQMKWYSTSLRFKSIPCIVIVNLLLIGLIIAIGVLCSYIMFFVENGFWEGRSLYGFIFFSPLFYIPIAMLLRIKYLDLLDFCAPCISYVLALAKILCMLDGCCFGKILYQDENYMYVRFPSREVEMAIFFVLAIMIFSLSKFKMFRRKIYPIFLVLYAILRFGLTYMREDAGILALGLPAGAFWSLVAFVIGAIWLLVCILICKRKKFKDIIFDK